MQANVTIDSDRRAALREIQQKIDLASVDYGVAGAAAIGGLAISNPLLAMAGLAGAAVALDNIQKLNQLVRTLTVILDAFEKRIEIEYLTQLEVPDNGVLDLLVKFLTARVNFAIALRSQGQATITYKEEKEALYRRNKSGGLKPWTPDHIHRLNEQEFFLRKYQNHLLGSSSRQRCRPIVKLLVLTGETRLGQHPEHLYVTIGQEKVLLLKKRISVYVMEEKQLVPFIEGFLAQK